MANHVSNSDQIRQGVTISGPFIPKAIEVLAVIPFGDSLKVIGRGTKSDRSYDCSVSIEMAQSWPKLRENLPSVDRQGPLF